MRQRPHNCQTCESKADEQRAKCDQVEMNVCLSTDLIYAPKSNNLNFLGRIKLNDEESIDQPAIQPLSDLMRCINRWWLFIMMIIKFFAQHESTTECPDPEHLYLALVSSYLHWLGG